MVDMAELQNRCDEAVGVWMPAEAEQLWTQKVQIAEQDPIPGLLLEPVGQKISVVGIYCIAGCRIL